MAHVSAAARVGVSTRARTQLRPPARVSVHAMRPRATSAAAGAEPGGEDSNAAKKPRVVIAGAGIIGSSIAYHLAVNHGYASTLVDKVGPGAAASGKAAGFLALDWCDGGDGYRTRGYKIPRVRVASSPRRELWTRGERSTTEAVSFQPNTPF